MTKFALLRLFGLVNISKDVHDVHWQYCSMLYITGFPWQICPYCVVLAKIHDTSSLSYIYA
jgi:hypothetical protein